MVKVDIHKIKVEWLSVDCLATLSKYVQKAHEYDGVVLPLQSKRLLSLVSKHVKTVDSDILNDLYMELKGQLKICLADPRLRSMIRAQSGDYDIEVTSSIEYRDFAA